MDLEGIYIFLKNEFLYFWLCQIFVAVRAFLQLWRAAFSWCVAGASVPAAPGSAAQAQWLWQMGLAALWHVGFCGLWIEPTSPALAGEFFMSHQGSPKNYILRARSLIIHKHRKFFHLFRFLIFSAEMQHNFHVICFPILNIL